MTEFEKLVTETPITMDCFKMDDFESHIYLERDNMHPSATNVKMNWDSLILFLEYLRQKYKETKDERYLKELMRLLPNTYRVKKDNIQYEFGEVKHLFIL